MNNTFNKVSLLIVVVCITIVCIVLYKYKKVCAENITLQTALNKPSVVQKPKYIVTTKVVYKDVVNNVEKPVLVEGSGNEEDMIKLINYYDNRVAELEARQPEEITREVYVNEGYTSTPEVPKIVDIQKQKDWTAMAEYKFNDGINLGISRRVLGELSIGGSVNQNSKIGILGLYRW